MLTQLSSIKLRLALATTDTTYDVLLTSAINAVSARFDCETNRTLARTVNATHEFDAADTQISVPCYPIESVAKFELKSSESGGWLQQGDVQYLVRHSCIISLSSVLCPLSSGSPASHTPVATSSQAPRSLLPAPRCLRTWKTPPPSKSPAGSKPATTSV
jgi:hypothetical protein